MFKVGGGALTVAMVDHHPNHDHDHDEVQRCSSTLYPHYSITPYIRRVTRALDSKGCHHFENDAQSAVALPHRDSSGPLFRVSHVYSCLESVITTIETDTTHHVFGYSSTQPTSSTFTLLSP